MSLPSLRRCASLALPALATFAAASQAQAEDATTPAAAPTPAPVAPGAVPVTPGAPVAPGAENPTAPGSFTGTAHSDAAATPVKNGAQFRWYSLGAMLSGGYDSNVLHAAANTPTPSGQHSAALGVDAHATVRILDAPEHGLVTADTTRLAASPSLGYDDYPGHEKERLLRAGGLVVGHQRFGTWDPGLLVSYNHYALDGKSVANVTSGEAFVSHIYPSYKNVDILTGGVQYLAFPTEQDRSGSLIGLGLRHWFLPTAKETRRRIEFGLAVSDYVAKSDVQSYLGITPSLGTSWRLGAVEPTTGTIDLGALAQYEYRGYRETNPLGNERERQQILSLSGNADYWLCRNATLGGYVGLTRRMSNIDPDQYTRFQIGARLGMSY